MDQFNEIKSARIIYFSGTGGTRRIVDAFEKELTARGLDAAVRNLGASLQEKKSAPEALESGRVDLSILIYPVYALDAPKPIYDWIESVSSAEAGEKIVVLSVSGGGEMWPNKGCRNNCCKALEDRGFQVVYDRMLCMPANVLVEYNDHLAIRLIRIIPERVAQITDEFLAGKVRRTHFRKGPVLDWISRTERKNSCKFAEKFQISEDCTSCGWCVRNCPMSNIEIPEGASLPQFLNRCVICTRCVYGCPAHAIKVNGSMTLKSGFDLEAVERRMEGVEPEPLEKCCKGWIYMGVKDYLLNKY